MFYISSMSQEPIREPIWYKQPTVLFAKNKWKKFFPTSRMTTVEIFNAVLRFSIYQFIIISIITDNLDTAIVPFLVMIFSFFLEFFPIKKDIYKPKKTHSDLAKILKKDDIDPHQYTPEEAQQLLHELNENKQLPSKDNPFMNPLLTDLSTGKPRNEAANAEENSAVKKLTEYHFDQNLFKESDDIYNKNNSQNRFYTVPNTNEYGVAYGDSVKFASWLYSIPAPTCKEDTSYCANNYSFYNSFDNRF